MTNTPDHSAALSPKTAHVGLIGIGNMGEPMAANLLKAGYSVQVYDVDPSKGAKFVAAHGGSFAATLAEIGRNCNVIITMVPDGKIVRKVVLGDGGSDHVLSAAAHGTIIIDMSSSSPVGTRELGIELSARGTPFLDAPVSGGVKGAAAATLAIMVGGDEALAQRCDPLLAAMGKRFYIGALGAGHAMKVLNNYVSAAGLMAAGEAVLIGKNFGIAPQKMIDVINASTGRNNSTENKFSQFILNKKFNSGFSMGLMAKDLALAMEVAGSCGISAELGHATLALWKAAETKLTGKADHTEVVRHFGEI